MTATTELRRRLLAIDSGANYLLGVPLMVMPRRTAAVLGLPHEDGEFYPRVLGGVLTGVATALAIEHRRSGRDAPVGLGIAGAGAVNALGGGAVAAWLASSESAGIPRRGRLLLWGVACGVLSVGTIEAWEQFRRPD